MTQVIVIGSIITIISIVLGLKVYSTYNPGSLSNSLSVILNSWRYVAITTVVGLVIAGIFWWSPWISSDTGEKLAERKPLVERLNTVVPTERFGSWTILVSSEFPTRAICPPEGSYTSVDRKDPSIGLLFRIQRPSGKWLSGLQKHPPGKELHMDVGPFRCLTVQAMEGETTAKVVISRTPTS
jgi:hypothetical protein|tara:strand:+ start:1066 stop:1614 length:549 start_codon:yes stop_codon:yes gene_type:complete